MYPALPYELFTYLATDRERDTRRARLLVRADRGDAPPAPAPRLRPLVARLRRADIGLLTSVAGLRAALVGRMTSRRAAAGSHAGAGRVAGTGAAVRPRSLHGPADCR